METLTEIVRKTGITRRWNIGSALAKVAEKGLVEDINTYKEGGLKYPNGNGGVKEFNKEETKHLCAGRIYSGIMRLARHGVTKKALEYAAMFDKEFTLDHVHKESVYIE
jgi:hypothetical protein